ncbi:electron transfer flavoprotein subunit alpha/FixB family protein [Chlorobaculum sp. MV4-Y]|jgi:electron transfer flavoprotein alpha subunit|uniref:electron transfer flavoprotein subunit alpha/FixB family protein n=1 Tax=Chlorobaculum sp. MV4-Y TaxID=2976335 RepID=UPI0021AFFD41|nr:electron transfer flavoprotein subunit alpha/FixB family protein [Chlorobaculum sp. MV4-Y]UWX57503.1 electron transfer flavoprotein subunit alpha/FixB family protein [Chlorobaculum sp. MV4-Y]
MKLLLVGEVRDGRLTAETAELFGFAARLGAEISMVLAGAADDIPAFDGRLYRAEAGNEYDAAYCKRLVLAAVEREQPDAVVFPHSSLGWNVAPRVAFAMQAAQVSSVAGLDDGGYVVESCNGKMRRTVTPLTDFVVLTIQPGAFAAVPMAGTSEVIAIAAEPDAAIEFLGCIEPERGIDLTRAGVIVSAGRGVGSAERVELVRALADALGGEVGASRPAVDAGWLERARQVGSSGQNVSPELYVACGISGAIQHLAGMKGSGFVLAVNPDRDAPIASVADVLAVSDVAEFLPALTAAIRERQ